MMTTTSGGGAVGDATLGGHLARRLVQVGVSDVPGDFNLTLLVRGMLQRAQRRVRGVGACAVTFTMGVLNAIAGAYSENLPVICIVGGPNSNDYGTNRARPPPHHGPPRLLAGAALLPARHLPPGRLVNNLDDAHEQIDLAISTALKESKPVYISVSCNDLPGIPHPTFTHDPVPYFLVPRASNQTGLEAAAAFLDKAMKPVMVAGATRASCRRRRCRASSAPTGARLNHSSRSRLKRRICRQKPNK
jgi:pyruvate decarboxylase